MSDKRQNFLQEIAYYQKYSDDLLIPRQSFHTLCLEIIDKVAKEDFQYFPSSATIHTMSFDNFNRRFKEEPLIVLQMAAEKFACVYDLCLATIDGHNFPLL